LKTHEIPAFVAGADLILLPAFPTVRPLGGSVMNIGKTLFAQLMDFLPWSTFDRIVARHGGDRAIRTLPCNVH
jgi:Domain of unknown function (DUF4372)